MSIPKLPMKVLYIIERLNDSSYRADIVGGCVRDFLLSKEPADYDITTSATPDEMREVFRDMKTVETGIKHGTLTVIYGGIPFEITTYREDGDYKDHRHPDKVNFSRKIEDDLSRRDFTVNAIAYNPRDGLTDLFGGEEDIKKGIIRAVGDAGVRFDEDALRILRAVRFSATLGFEIEEKTALAAVEKRSLLSAISGERIASEWKKLLGGKNAYRVISLFPDIISEFLLPGENILLPDKDRFACASNELRELSIFALSAKNPAIAFFKAAEALRYDNRRKRFGITVLENLSYSSVSTDAGIRELLMKVGAECAGGIIELRAMLGLSDDSAISSYLRILERREPYRISDLDISGNDIMSLKIRGSAVGKILQDLLLAVVKGEIKNERSALFSEAKRLAEFKK